MNCTDEEDDACRQAQHTGNHEPRHTVRRRKDVHAIGTMGPGEIAAATGHDGANQELNDTYQHFAIPSGSRFCTCYPDMPGCEGPAPAKA